jgi:hypothetical protein
MAWKMRPAFHKLRIELESLSERQDDWQLHSQAEGLLWCHTMLNYNTDQSTMPDTVREAMKRFNTIPFTSSGETYLKSWRPYYRFNYNFNEPLLQQALCDRMMNSLDIARHGIKSFLSMDTNVRPSLDAIAVLSLFANHHTNEVREPYEQHSVWRALWKGTKWERHYAKYDFQVSHIVRTDRNEDQLEWFRKLLEDPKDTTFSLLPEVPVSEIAVLLSSNDCVDVVLMAAHKSQQKAALKIVQFQPARLDGKTVNDVKRFGVSPNKFHQAKQWIKLAKNECHRAVDIVPINLTFAEAIGDAASATLKGMEVFGLDSN